MKMVFCWTMSIAPAPGPHRLLPPHPFGRGSVYELPGNQLSGVCRAQVHPTIMFGLLGVTIYTGILGWNYRQARLIPVRTPPSHAALMIRGAALRAIAVTRAASPVALAAPQRRAAAASEQAEVKELKGQLPSDEEAKASSPLQGQIKELETVRQTHCRPGAGHPHTLLIITHTLLIIRERGDDPPPGGGGWGRCFFG